MKQILLPSGKPIQRRTIFNNSARRREFYFYVGLIALPLIQFILMYICVNFRSILFVFQTYDQSTTSYVYGWQYAYLNFSEVISTFTQLPLLGIAWKNSIVFYVLQLIIITPLSILTSFFIYKKLPLAGYFRIVLYLPNIVSGMATVLGYKYLVEYGISGLLNVDGSLFNNPATSFNVLVFFSLWTALGGSLIMTTGVMSRTSVELLEASRMDGVNFLQELVHIVFPVIYPVITIGLYTGVVAVFTGGPPIYSFFGAEAPTEEMYTVQYYLFTLVVGSKAGDANYPFAATSGLLLTLIAAPIVFTLKYLFEKYDPNEDNPKFQERRKKKYGLA
ncbi:MAG: hypothetical protein DBX59_04810 [Bacillota bacterium]|nr:MAG: hypothetical protein DBX59_04810 [Bacillota bacterium]